MIFDVISIILGLGCMGVGIWMHADKDVYAYLYVMSRGPEDSMMTSAAAILIAAGIMLVGSGILGILGLLQRRKLFLTLVLVLLFVILPLTMAAGFGALAFRDDFHWHVKEGMRKQIQEDYMWDNPTGLAWNRVQVRRRCCGVDGSWDYQGSNWWYSENPGVEHPADALNHVPPSCCTLEFNQDRDIKRVDPQQPKPRDPIRCQQDAAGRKDGSDNLNGRGCFAALHSFAFVYIYVIMGLGIGVSVILMMGIAIDCLLMRHMTPAEGK